MYKYMHVHTSRLNLLRTALRLRETKHLELDLTYNIRLYTLQRAVK